MTDRPAPSRPAAPTPAPPARLFGGTDPHHGRPLPPGTHSLGMWLFLIALTMLFLAGLLAYVIVRLAAANPVEGALVAATPLHTIKMPLVLWLSTGAILISSYTLHRAVDNVRHERQAKLRQALSATILLAVPFLLAQAAGLAMLLSTQTDLPGGGGALRKAVVFLVVVHALHVIGGLIPLGVVAKRAHEGRYDHEFCTPVVNLARYWHFLDGVWLTMFLTFLALG